MGFGLGVTFVPILGHFGGGLPEKLLNQFWVALIILLLQS